MCGGLWKISEYHKYLQLQRFCAKFTVKPQRFCPKFTYSTMVLFEIPERTYQTMHLRGQFALHSPQFVHLS